MTQKIRKKNNQIDQPLLFLLKIDQLFRTYLYFSNYLIMQTPTVLVRKAQITFYSPTTIATLNQQINTLVQASYSFVLTLANYILFHHPNLPPPNLQSVKFQIEEKDLEYPQSHLTHNKLYQHWCDYLGLLIFSKNVYQIEQTCHLFSQVSESFISKLDKTIFKFQIFSFDEYSISQTSQPISNIIKEHFYSVQTKNKKQIKNYKKIAIVNISTSQLREDKQQPKMHLPGLFAGIFYNESDEWVIYNILKGEYPTETQYQQLDILILSGSSLSVNDNDIHVNTFAQGLKIALQKNKNLKILGICFGHQLIAKMFGGTVIKKHLLTGVQTIIFDQNILDKASYFQRTQLNQNQFSLSEYHQDFVQQVPLNFHILARSATCKTQSLISNDGRFLSFQFHPQYSAQYIKAFQARACQYSKHHNVKTCYSHKQIGGIEHDQSLLIIRKVIRKFIDWIPEQLDLGKLSLL